MPNRILKESICESRGLSEVSFFAEDLYKRLITYADDYGRFNADFQIVLARLYPREIGIVSLDDIEDAMTELIGAGKITFYTSEARKELYGCFPNWAEHQRVRDSKRKMPAPSDTAVNDWYLKRFVPKDLKRRIIERDKMKCCECGKYICAEASSADRIIKFCAGMYHIDHIVPVDQGGRATEENLRLLCPHCNLTRKRRFTVEEIINFSQPAETRGNSPQLAAARGETQQSAARARAESNPIQSYTHTDINPPHETRTREGRWFDPEHPDDDCDTGWLSDKGRGAVTQRIMDWACKRDGFSTVPEEDEYGQMGAELYTMIAGAMRNGIHPATITKALADCDGLASAERQVAALIKGQVGIDGLRTISEAWGERAWAEYQAELKNAAAWM